MKNSAIAIVKAKMEGFAQRQAQRDKARKEGILHSMILKLRRQGTLNTLNDARSALFAHGFRFTEENKWGVVILAVHGVKLAYTPDKRLNAYTRAYNRNPLRSYVKAQVSPQAR